MAQRAARGGVPPPQMCCRTIQPTPSSERRRQSGQQGGQQPRLGRFRGRQEKGRTVKLGLLGWILSSASTQIPLVSFRDW